MLLRLLSIFVIVITTAGLAGCAELRGSRPAKRPGQPTVTKPQQVVSPDGVEREIIRPVSPQLASLKTPQRLASLEIVERGKAFLARREFDKALQMFQEAVTVDGTNGIAYYYLARVRYELRQWPEAMGLLERAESLLGDSPEWLANVEELRAIIRTAQS
ncbi:MAG: tetratricopeptide repeat protein [Deltaproteobacteria bacterium]|nr:tetratricopeptide repeat protein [Deltaproteobacteria bacterium]